MDLTLQRSVLPSAASCVVLLLALSPMRATESQADVTRKIEPRVVAETEGGQTTQSVVLLSDQADLSAAYALRDPDARGWYVYNTLREHARQSQRELRQALRGRGIPSRSLWAVNALVVSGDRALMDELAARGDVRAIESNRRVGWIRDPRPITPPDGSGGAGADRERLGWGVVSVNAPQVWAMGYTGQGIVIGIHDDGVQWDHPALRSQYRGWNGSEADHNYNWHDAIHVSGTTCEGSSPVPCDSEFHGTAMTGIAVGDDGAGNKIGVAPGAQWFACRSIDEHNAGTPASYTECLQFFLAPTDLDGTHADPTRRPHIVNNSLTCDAAEGCAPNTLQTVVENLEAAGIFIVAAAGNFGPGCSTAVAGPGIYDASFTIGAYDASGMLAELSARGPVTVDGSNRLKPDVVAPGVLVRTSSSVQGGTYVNLTGTSVAAPHVAGVVALLWSARPELARDIAATRAILEESANPDVTVNPGETCGDTPLTTIPNNSFGYGRVDALAALSAVPESTATPTPTATAPRSMASDDGGCAIAPAADTRGHWTLLPLLYCAGLAWGRRRRIVRAHQRDPSTTIDEDALARSDGASRMLPVLRQRTFPSIPSVVNGFK
jgi:serine protease AprX